MKIRKQEITKGVKREKVEEERDRRKSKERGRMQQRDSDPYEICVRGWSATWTREGKEKGLGTKN